MTDRAYGFLPHRRAGSDPRRDRQDLGALRRCVLARAGPPRALSACLPPRLAADGWLGIAMPEEYGGAGLGITEAALMMQTIAESGAGLSGRAPGAMKYFCPHP